MSPKLLYTMFLMTITSGVFACTCVPDQSIVNAFKSADLVFAGKVVKIDTVFISDTANIIGSPESKPHIEVILRKFLAVKFRIIRLFKGYNKKMIITVMTDAVDARCGFQFVLDVDYLVYGYTELFSLVTKRNLDTNQKPDIQANTLNYRKYSTNSCTRTTIAIKSEISELKSNKLIK